LGYDPATGAINWFVFGHQGTSYASSSANMAFSPDGASMYLANPKRVKDVSLQQSNTTNWGRYLGSSLNPFTPTGIALSPDGSKLFVTGYYLCGACTWRPHGRDFQTVAVNAASGALLWRKQYNGPASGDDTANAIAVSPDGSKVFVTGQSAGAGTGIDYETIAYTATTGSVAWSTRYNDPLNGDDTARAIGISPDGSTIYVAGSATEEQGSIRPNTDFFVIAYATATGSQSWTASYAGEGQDNPDDAYALGVSPDGSHIIVTGSSTAAGGSNTDYATVSWGPTGALQWVQRFNGPSSLDDSPTAMAISPDGSKVFVTGWTQSTSTGKAWATLAYGTATGGWLWRRLNYGPNNGDDIANAIAVSPDSSEVVVTGSTYSGDPSLSSWSTQAYATG
jgi:DNA-binding beta-propeller fold protein YncE